MNENDDKNESRGGWKRSASSGSNPDRIPSRNTAPAGTPAHKAPSASPRSVPIDPEPVAPPPVAIVNGPNSDRPLPDVDTISPARTVGGQTARLKAKQPPAAAPTVDEGLSPQSKDDKNAAAAQKPRASADPAEDARAKSPPAAARSGAKGARGAKDGASWEADVKISNTEPAGHGGPAAAAAGMYVESRWPFAIAIGAVAFAIGSLLPLPFRKQIVGSAGEPTAVAVPRPSPSSAARGMEAVPAQPPSTAPSSPAGPSPSAPSAEATPSLMAEPSDNPSAAPATAAPAASARPGPASSGGKGPTKGEPTKGGGKPGRVGDIF